MDDQVSTHGIEVSTHEIRGQSWKMNNLVLTHEDNDLRQSKVSTYNDYIF